MSEALDDLIARLDVRSDAFKAAWVDAALERFDEVAPRLVAYLEQAVADPVGFDRSRGAALGHLYALAVLAHRHEARAHDVVADLASLPPDVLDSLLGWFVMEGLAGALAATSGGRTDRLVALLADDAADEYARGAAADALAFLAHRGEADRAAVVERLAGHLHSASSHVAARAVVALVDLHAVDRRDAIEAAYAAGTVEEATFGPEEVEALFAEGPEAAAARLEHRLTREMPQDPRGVLGGMYDLPDLPPPHRDRDEARPAAPRTAAPPPPRRDPAKARAKRKSARAARKKQRKR